MLILRIIGFLTLLSIGGCFTMYLFRRDRRYLRLAGQIFRFALVVIAAAMALYLLERLILLV
jgi:hypothetical protein